MSRRPYEVLHLFTPPDGSGGGMAAYMGRYGSLDQAIAVGTIRLTQNMDPSPHDRIQIKDRRPGFGGRPTWLYRDGTGGVCMWRLHESQQREAWGYAS